jgi:hypothetical protein
VNNVFFLHEDQLPPQQWKLVMVTAIHLGKDGMVRTITVKTDSGGCKKLITKVCLLQTTRDIID